MRRSNDGERFVAAPTAASSAYMSQTLSALRLRAALHLLSLEGADISNIVRQHAQSLGLSVDVCEPLSREIASALDAVVALAAHSTEVSNSSTAAAAPLYEGAAGSGDWFGGAALGSDYGEFAFPAFQHRDGGGEMTLQVRAGVAIDARVLRLTRGCCD
jgi:hypothetical protein